ncbi:hypothetical protein T484DRAFT_1829053 [Baffinella frigidus]|nr:hypothetical protein T484DRAFT_1829053 [Cryptophyta sp. CCMP2293]
MRREGGGGAAAKRAKMNPVQSMSTEDVIEINPAWLENEEDQETAEMKLRCKHGPEGGGEEPAAPSCIWKGRVNALAGHLKSCDHEPVKCANAAAGCKEPVLRKDAARHASETCAFRQVCVHCRNSFAALALPEHEGGCPEAQVECPNSGCGATFARRSMGEHRGVCGREEVECPCPECEERMARAEVGTHVETSRAVHEQMAWKRAAEMKALVVEQRGEIAKQREIIAAQANSLEEQGGVIVEQKAAFAAFCSASTAKALVQAAEIETQNTINAGLINAGLEMEENAALLQGEIKNQRTINAGVRKRAEALTRVFTWSMDGSWGHNNSLPYTFTDGVRGSCFNTTLANKKLNKHWMGFQLEEGPACMMHYRCSILDKNDKILRVVSPPGWCDFHTPPRDTAPIRQGNGVGFDVTNADKAGAVRADGSIKLRVVVHLYLPE